MSPEGPRLHPLWLSFDDEETERAYWASFATANLAFVRGGVVLFTVLFATFGIVDLAVFPTDAALLLCGVRYGLSIPLMLLGWPAVLAPRYRPLVDRWVQELLLYYGVVGVGSILVMGSLITALNSWGETTLEVVVGVLGLTTTITFLYGFSRMRLSYVVPLGVTASVVGVFYLFVFVGPPLPISLSLSAYAAIANVVGGWVARNLEIQARRDFVRERQIREAREVSERLLREVLPGDVVDALRAEHVDGAHVGPRATRVRSVTVVVVDVVGFTPLAERLPPAELAAVLDHLFGALDRLARAHGVEKVKTLGDGWVGVVGLPLPVEDHAAVAVRFAEAVIASLGEHAALPHGLSVRVGVDTGTAVAGVIGTRRFAWDVWGPAVDGATAMERTSQPGALQLGPGTLAALAATA